MSTGGPADYNYDETLSTLRYASRAKQIKNKPRINEVLFLSCDWSLCAVDVTARCVAYWGRTPKTRCYVNSKRRSSDYGVRCRTGGREEVNVCCTFRSVKQSLQRRLFCRSLGWWLRGPWWQSYRRAHCRGTVINPSLCSHSHASLASDAIRRRKLWRWSASWRSTSACPRRK